MPHRHLDYFHLTDSEAFQRGRLAQAQEDRRGTEVDRLEGELEVLYERKGTRKREVEEAKRRLEDVENDINAKIRQIRHECFK